MGVALFFLAMMLLMLGVNHKKDLTVYFQNGLAAPVIRKARSSLSVYYAADCGQSSGL